MTRALIAVSLGILLLTACPAGTDRTSDEATPSASPTRSPAVSGPSLLLYRREGSQRRLQRFFLPSGPAVDLPAQPPDLPQTSYRLSADGRLLAWARGRRIYIGASTEGHPTEIALELPKDGFVNTPGVRPLIAWSMNGSALLALERRELDEVDFDGPSRYRMHIWHPDRPIRVRTFEHERLISLVGFDEAKHRLFWVDPRDGGGFTKLTEFDYRTGRKKNFGGRLPTRRQLPWLSPDGTEALFVVSSDPQRFDFNQIVRLNLTTRDVEILHEETEADGTINANVSPSGDGIAFTFTPWDKPGLLHRSRMSLITTKEPVPQRFFDHGQACHTARSWSPDGTFVFLSPTLSEVEWCEWGNRYFIYDTSLDQQVGELAVPREKPDGRWWENRGSVSVVGWLPPGDP